MPQQGFSVGRDVSTVLILADGSSLPLEKVTGFNAKPDTSTQKVKGLDGTIINLRWHEGWSGSFMIERRSALIDQYFAQVEADYHAGQDEKPATLQQTIQEPDGTISQYRFTEVLLTYDDAGDWAADKTVSQKIGFVAHRRIQQA
jgi:hypothetical protein